ncbi:MAG: hypothetical protein KGZ58_04970 [Ignavibacteriales bacterium]|nr:hypothetical protein [Ignavibacteriales bacterium]
MSFKIFVATVTCFAIFFSETFSQKWFQESYRLQSAATSLSRPPSNSVSQLRFRDSAGTGILWIGTSKGLASTVNGAISFTSYRAFPAFVKDGIFSLSVHNDTIWTSLGYTKDFQDGEVQTGAGYAYSLNNGFSWSHKSQTLDGRYDDTIQYGNNFLRILPVIVSEQNVTYDLSIAPNGTVWIASWASGLRRLTNYAAPKWERILLPPDFLSKLHPDSTYNFNYDPRPYHNIKGFSVFASDDSTVWCGTAGGINLSKNANDSFPSWTKFSHQNQAAPILGNWVIAIDGQTFYRNTNIISRIWCTNWRAESSDEEFGVSYTEDEGRSWKNFLHGIKAFDFAFKDSIAYITTVEGLYRTSDGGVSFVKNGDIRDERGNILAYPSFYTVEVIGDTLFCGTADGLLKTIDNSSHPFGERWEILRTYQPIGKQNTTYAYPNPFSPRFEITRIHFSTKGKTEKTTIEVFDFGMNRVRTLIRDAERIGSVEHDEIWNGTDDNNDAVSNGVYFYRVTIGSDEPIWGKVLVLQ